MNRLKLNRPLFLILYLLVFQLSFFVATTDRLFFRPEGFKFLDYMYTTYTLAFVDPVFFIKEHGLTSVLGYPGMVYLSHDFIKTLPLFAVMMLLVYIRCTTLGLSNSDKVKWMAGQLLPLMPIITFIYFAKTTKEPLRASALTREADIQRVLALRRQNEQGMTPMQQGGGQGMPSVRRTKFCWHCGKEIPISATFCPKCGTNLKQKQDEGGRKS